MLKGLLVVVILTLPALAQDQHPARTSAGCGLATIEFDVKGDKGLHSVTPPDAGKAAVYVIQWEKLDVDTFHIGAVTTRVGLDGSWQGANRGDSFLLFSVDPGEHHICVDWQSSLRKLAKAGSAVTLTSEAGKTYYFRATVDTRQKYPASVVLEALDPAEGQLLISKSSLSKSHPRN